MSKYYIGFTSDHDPNSVLRHHGIRGMSWYKHKFGPWQKQAQYAAGQDDPDAESSENSSDYIFPETETILNDKEVSSALKELDSVNSMAKKYNSDEGLQDKYCEKAAKKCFEEWCKDDPDYNTKENLDRIVNWYKYDDGDQGDFNSFQMYLIDKGVHPSDYTKHVHAAYDTFQKAVANALESSDLDYRQRANVEAELSNDGWTWRKDKSEWSTVDHIIYNTYVSEEMGYMSPGAREEAANMLQNRKKNK